MGEETEGMSSPLPGQGALVGVAVSLRGVRWKDHNLDAGSFVLDYRTLVSWHFIFCGWSSYIFSYTFRYNGTEIYFCRVAEDSLDVASRVM